MKKLFMLLTIVSLLLISSCTSYPSQSPIIDYKNTTQQNKDNIPSSSNIITASFVIVPPDQNNTGQ